MKKISSLKTFVQRFTHVLRRELSVPALPRCSTARSLRSAVFAGATVFAGLTGFTAQASTILKQTFSDSWSVEPYFYSDQTSAWQWSYTPYLTWDASLGTLTGVKIHTTLTGERQDANEAVFLRTAFFTGWDPVQYQYEKEDSIAGGATGFAYDHAVSFLGADLSSWLSYDYLPLAHYYFESRTYGAGHSINATTTLEYIYEPGPVSSVPDNGSTALALGGALVGLVALRRRHARSAHA